MDRARTIATFVLALCLLSPISPACWASNEGQMIGYFAHQPPEPIAGQPITVRWFANELYQYGTIGGPQILVSGNYVYIDAYILGRFTPNPLPPAHYVVTIDVPGLAPGTYTFVESVYYVDITLDLLYSMQDTVHVSAAPATATTEVVEYYNPQLDHYFMTALQAEIAALDGQSVPGWLRTGERFKVDVGSTHGAMPVCRFYIPPALGDSHFYSAYANECDVILASVAFGVLPFDYVPETAAAFYAELPQASGHCASPTIPLYRLWNGRADSDHRYTISPTIRAEMLAKGYVSEGAGADGVAMCVHPPAS